MSALPEEDPPVSPQRRELLRLVKELPEERVPSLLETVRHEVEDALPPHLAALVGVMDAEPDLSARYKEILREEHRK
ncbi:hypothetical protein HDA32_003633 [Spinactinospora alkalitolerans]|uniref:Uncharacterized protein n=1 Tax=Spinactinospora alkalitolerans TaxID=687207 RepID=A0A852U0I3_9ACTN|nr:hypothetical protein [Spinactinospora alkalitolerans]NYE48513.1 hypothetical protein [Spinactinospora alkalitolerans]